MLTQALLDEFLTRTKAAFKRLGITNLRCIPFMFAYQDLQAALPPELDQSTDPTLMALFHRALAELTKLETR